MLSPSAAEGEHHQVIAGERTHEGERVHSHSRRPVESTTRMQKIETCRAAAEAVMAARSTRKLSVSSAHD